MADALDTAVESALAEYETTAKAENAENLKSELAAFDTGEEESAEGSTEVEASAETPEVEAKSEEKDDALSRITEREEALRTKESDFEKRVAAEVERRSPKFKDEDEVLEHYKVDREFLFKRMLFERAKDGPLKDQLKDELRDYHTNKELDKLRNEIKQKETVSANQAFYNKVVSDTRKEVESVDSKQFDVIHQLVKAGKVDYVHSKVIAEISKDASDRLARGEDGDILSAAEAMRRVEEDLRNLAEVFKAKKDAAAPAKVSKPSIGSPTATKNLAKPQLSREQQIELALKQAMTDLA